MRQGSIRFDRNELAGAFGDIGTDLPLIVGMILAAGLDSASALIMFGVMQIFTGLRYGIPMPVQPLKAMAALVIAQKLSGGVLFGGGLVIGVIMLLLTVTGLIEWLARVVPKTVVRGIQFGLGLQLAMLAVKDYVRADGAAGYLLAAVGFFITIALMGNRRFPAALFVIALGVIYAFIFKIDLNVLWHGTGLHLPQVRGLSRQDLLTGLVVLAVPQIPLSLGNSILATRQVAEDFFPERPLTIRTISFTYSIMNLVNPWFGGIPTCHGSGGMAGHYTFGARTGGSVIIYGGLYLVLGLFFSGCFAQMIQVFPKPILGVMLAFEGLAMLLLVRDIANSKADLFIAMLVGLMAVGLPYGYAIGLIVGTALVYLWRNRQQAI
ncbi:MAG TPA: molybdate transporter family protein [Verrucomicrobiae bacterium]|nr:molybdate transporter family protein [Verrucomicrobiae bacterium]